jgi:cation diffusion facilitator CzcD-associated flavoprotein CzcO
VRAALGLASPLVTGAHLDIAAQRSRAEAVARLQLPQFGTRVERTILGGVPAERLRPDGAVRNAALLYLHGGGYCIGSPRTHRALAARLAGAAGVAAYVPDYRLAPEHPHPAALDDALAAYRALLDAGFAPGRVLVAGDSAGGGLALALAMALRDAGEPAPAAVGMICPWLDLAPDHAGGRPASGRDALLSPGALTAWARAYADGHGPEHPAVSPLHGDLSGLPPLVLHSAGDDVLAADAERLAARARDIEHRRMDGLWHVPHALTGVMAAADDAVDELGASLARRLEAAGPSVAIVGAGMSGLCMGEALKQAGLEDFTIYEKASEVGGTWRENRYPGLTCDVPSRFYSFSFAPNPGWSSAFSPGAEIQEYFVRTAAERGLRERIRFDAEVSDARWDGERWRLRTAAGEEAVADVVVTATGVLHHPKLPDIPGRETFAGAAFHSARWDEGVDLRGRRVAVIGTGSTGVQITVATAGVAERLLLFQRTPQWILPVPNREYSRADRALMRRVPALNRLTYRVNQVALEAILGPAVTRPSWQRRAIGALCRANLRFGVRDPALREALTPDYEPMCKRLVMSAGFYPAMGRDDVELVTSRIERIVPEGIVTGDGVLHELDAIVFATGFDPHAYMRPMAITGEDGRTLDEAWADGPRAYRTVALPGFPNLFTLMGPHSPVGNHSLIAVAETQAAYVVAWIERMRQAGLATVAPTDEATDAYYDRLRAAFPGTIWVTGCDSWYLDADGVPELWPWTPGRHRRMLAEPEVADFRVAAYAANE